MQQHFGDSHSYWCMEFVSRGFEFTEEDLAAVRIAVELLGGVRGRHKYQSEQRASWDRSDGSKRTNRISVSCTQGQRPGRTAQAYRVLEQRYPDVRFTMLNSDLRRSLNAQGLDIVDPS